MDEMPQNSNADLMDTFLPSTYQDTNAQLNKKAKYLL